jgi:AcrR family transcriptional regulator
MPYPNGHREEVREKIIRSARKLFNQRGFESVSVNQIMADTGLTRGGFYSYFKSKSDLYVEALACFFTDPDWKDSWEGVDIDLAAADIGAQIVRAYLSRQHLQAAGNSCPMVALPSDVARSAAPVKRAFETVFKAMVDVLERSLRGEHRDGAELGDGRGRGEITMRGDLRSGAGRCDGDRHQTAQAIAALCVGGMVVARSMEDRGLADQLLNASKVIALELGGWEDGKRAVGSYR